jgi:aminoglycoside 3-N-acetyltransferase
MLTLPPDAPPGPVLVHTDAFRMSHLAPRSLDRNVLLVSHVENVRTLADGRDLWVPTFNYDFCMTGLFDADRDPSQIGPINERIRQGGDWRTLVPVFNVAGFGPPPATTIELPDLVDPFDDESIFGDLVGAEGIIAWYGAPFSSTTLIHHTERMAGGVPYRYDKDFAGVVLHQGSRTDVVLRYLVRPLTPLVTYDWDRLARQAESVGVRQVLDDRGVLWWAPAKDLADLWIQEQQRDPLALLDDKSRAWIEPALKRLGRPFRLEDFESHGQVDARQR